MRNEKIASELHTVIALIKIVPTYNCYIIVYTIQRD
jgi:hypothetical protein